MLSRRYPHPRVSRTVACGLQTVPAFGSCRLLTTPRPPGCGEGSRVPGRAGGVNSVQPESAAAGALVNLARRWNFAATIDLHRPPPARDWPLWWLVPCADVCTCRRLYCSVGRRGLGRTLFRPAERHGTLCFNSTAPAGNGVGGGSTRNSFAAPLRRLKPCRPKPQREQTSRGSSQLTNRASRRRQALTE